MIVIVDYGMGNLRSVSKALEHLGASVRVSSSFKDIENADKVVVPGVGAFGDAVRELQSRDLVKPLKESIRSGKRFLGICLGLQLLFEQSEESPEARGLGVFPGQAVHFHSPGIKVPHMGWNQIEIQQDHPLLQGIPGGSFFYFVHSYYIPGDKKGLTAASCTYGQETFTAALGTDYVFATQFHPEKSQQAGLRILQNFISWGRS